MRTLRIAMAQINPTVGDIVGNTRMIKAWIKEARKAKADLVAFPELAVTGYPPEDLLLKPRFVEDNLRAIEEIAKDCKDLVAGSQVTTLGHIITAASVTHWRMMNGTTPRYMSRIVISGGATARR